MRFTISQIDRACGLLLLNEHNAFVYYCKECHRDFDSGPNLEMHILSEHQDDNGHIESVFLNDSIYVNGKNNSEAGSFEQHENSAIADVVLIKLEAIEINTDETKEINDNSEQINNNLHETNQKAEVKRKWSKENNEVLYCDMCPDAVFKTKDHLKLHMKRHMENRVRKMCSICKKKSSNLEKHMKINHTNERPYKCNFCEKTFTTNVNRKSHQHIHTGETPFLCSICGKTFKSQASQYRHKKRLHSGKLPHACKECDRSFVIPSELRDHINALHTHVRPFSCELCGESFSTKSYLRKHKLHHTDGIVQCRYCELKFKTNSIRRIHERTVHKVV